ncbi:MAG: hypothetical protein WBM80_07315 [Woeseiaceae bacterium]
MTYHQAKQPACTATEGAIELTIKPKTKDLGEFSVKRVLPSSKRRMVGPFIFFDHMGPAEFRQARASRFDRTRTLGWRQ